jgi:hypothetical protein
MRSRNEDMVLLAEPCSALAVHPGHARLVLSGNGAGYVAASLVSGNPAFARLPMYFLIGVPLSLFLTAYSTWRRYSRARAATDRGVPGVVSGAWSASGPATA